MLILLSQRGCWKPVPWGSPAHLQPWLGATPSPDGCISGQPATALQAPAVRQGRGLAASALLSGGSSLSFLGGEPSARRPLKRPDSQGRECWRQAKSENLPVGKERQATQDFSLSNRVSPCLRSWGDVCIEGLEQGNAFPRSSSKGDKTQPYNGFVSSFFLSCPAHSGVRSEAASQAGKFKLPWPQFPDGRAWVEISVLPFYEEGPNPGSLTEGERV